MRPSLLSRVLRRFVLLDADSSCAYYSLKQSGHGNMMAKYLLRHASNVDDLKRMRRLGFQAPPKFIQTPISALDSLCQLKV